MPKTELSDKETQQLEKSRYVVACLAKVYAENAIDESHTVSVTVRKNGKSNYVIDVDGHSIEFES